VSLGAVRPYLRGFPTYSVFHDEQSESLIEKSHPNNFFVDKTHHFSNRIKVKIIRYNIIKADNPSSLEYQIEEMIKVGYEPHGSLQVVIVDSEFLFLQPVIKRED